MPGLTPQVGFSRLAALNNAQLGQARVAVQSIDLRENALAKTMDARVKPAHDRSKILRRRTVISLLAGAAAWPLAARAQQRPSKIPRIGIIDRSEERRVGKE